jgi:hypothetical protein
MTPTVPGVHRRRPHRMYQAATELDTASLAELDRPVRLTPGQPISSSQAYGPVEAFQNSITLPSRTWKMRVVDRDAPAAPAGRGDRQRDTGTCFHIFRFGPRVPWADLAGQFV